MAINIIWDEQFTYIIHLVVEGSWTWEEFYQAMKEMHQQMDVSSHENIEFIVDMRAGNMLPKNILTHMRSVSSRRHDKSGIMVVVGASRFPQMLFDIMAKIVPDRMDKVHLTETIEKAYEIIFEKRRLHSDA